MNGFSWEALLRLCEVVSIGAGVLTVAALIGQVVAGRVVGNRKTLELENLKLSVAKQQEVASKLEIKAAEQQERAAIAESELLRLKDLTRPRAFTEEQLRQLSRLLPRVTEKFPIEIATPTHNPPGTDSAELCAQQLEKMFKDAGWRRVSLSIAGDVVLNGFRINFYWKEGERSVAMTTLLESFASLDRYHRISYMENVNPKNDVRAKITVGLDPKLY